MKRYLFFLMTVMIMVQLGCTMAPKYNQPALPVPDAWPNGGAAITSQAEDVRREPVAYTISWHDFFVDERLKKVIALALENNRDLRVAILNIEKTRAQYQIQRAALLPNVNAGGTHVELRVPRDFSPTGEPMQTRAYVAGLGTSAYELDLFGRVRSMKEQTLEHYLATEEARRSTQIALVAAVANTYLTLAGDHELLTLAQDTLKNEEAKFDLIRIRYDAGLSSELDLRQVQTRVEAARVDIARYTQLVAMDENALMFLVGSTVPQELLPKELETITLVKEISSGLPSETLLRRPDIQQAEHMLRGANANIGAARAAFFPRITLVSGAGYASVRLNDLFHPQSFAWAYAPMISMPIFDGGINLANLNASKAERDILVAQYEKAIQVAFREVADALAQKRTVGDQIAAQQSMVDATAKTYSLSDGRYKAGIDNYLSVLDAHRSLYSAQQGLITIRLAALTNSVTLYKVLGGGE